jgi:hypothetical protein
MSATVIGFILGALLGALTGTEVGIATGGVAGALVGLTVHVLMWMRAHAGSAPTLEQHRVMCTAYGQAADCEFEGDLGTGRWYDVKRCSILAEPDAVRCDKGCVRLMTLTDVRPGKRCANCKH